MGETIKSITNIKFIISVYTLFTNTQIFQKNLLFYSIFLCIATKITVDNIPNESLMTRYFSPPLILAYHQILVFLFNQVLYFLLGVKISSEVRFML